MGIEIEPVPKSPGPEAQTSIWKFRRGGIQFLHLEIDQDPRDAERIYGITWYTRVTTQKGLDAIRKSHAGLKGIYRETRELEQIRRLPFFDDDPESPSNIVGPVIFATNVVYRQKETGRSLYVMSGPSLIAIDLSTFLNPDSLKDKDGGQNPILWVRVNTEYLGYYFEGEAFLLPDPQVKEKPFDGDENFSIKITVDARRAMDPPKDPDREMAIIGDYDATDEILRIFCETSSTGLPDNELRELREVLGEALRAFPKFTAR